MPLGYRMWQKTESKLDLAASMVRQVMPELSSEKNVHFRKKHRKQHKIKYFYKSLKTVG